MKIIITVEIPEEEVEARLNEERVDRDKFIEIARQTFEREIAAGVPFNGKATLQITD